MTTPELAEWLVAELRTRQPSASYRREADFESDFVVPACLPILQAHVPKLQIATHPDGTRESTVRWAESKAWQTVHAWGMKHTFDLAARDPKSEWTMVSR